MSFGDSSFTWDFSQYFLDAGWTIDADGLYTPGSPADKIAAPTAERPNTFTGTTTSVVNTVNVAIAPTTPTTLGAAPAGLAYVEVSVPESIALFGIQSTPIVVTLLETLDDAELLGVSLLRPIPPYWFTAFEINIGALSTANQAIIAELELGDQFTATITFPAPVSPTSVTQKLFVEGISHSINPKTGHKVVIHAGPARIFDLFELDDVVLGVLDDVTVGIG